MVTQYTLGYHSVLPYYKIKTPIANTHRWAGTYISVTQFSFIILLFKKTFKFELICMFFICFYIEILTPLPARYHCIQFVH